MTFSCASPATARDALRALRDVADGGQAVIGIGQSLALALVGRSMACTPPAFASSFDAFEAQLRRMVGAEDAVIDALFKFTRPISGAYYWCPGMRGGRIDLSAVGV